MNGRKEAKIKRKTVFLVVSYFVTCKNPYSDRTIRTGEKEKKGAGMLQTHGLDVNQCFVLFFFIFCHMKERLLSFSTAAAAVAAAVVAAVFRLCPHIDTDDADDDGVHLHAFHSPMSNQSEHNIIIFQILVVLFCL